MAQDHKHKHKYLPEEKNGRENKHQEDLVFVSLNHQVLTFYWPSGRIWVSQSVCFHDNQQPNGTVPGDRIYKSVQNGLFLLLDQKRREEASKKMLMFERIQERRGSCVGGDYVTTTMDRTLCFYVCQLSNKNTFQLVCRVW